MEMQQELFPDYEIKENERLYVIGNGFDIHHWIDSKYVDFKKWVQKNKDPHLVRMMDTFFSNECDFWADIEKALGDYREEEITDFCEPDSPDDFKYDHPGQWQAGLEDSIPTIFGEVMDDFRDAFDEWVMSIGMPYLKEVATSVDSNCKWWLYYYSKDDMKKAEAAAAEMGLRDYCLRRFE